MNKISISLFFLFTILSYHGQEKLTNKKGSEYEFEVVKELERTLFKIKIEQEPVGVFLLFRFLNRSFKDWVRVLIISQKCILLEMLTSEKQRII
mgnify:CR=1 FL=1